MRTALAVGFTIGVLTAACQPQSQPAPAPRPAAAATEDPHAGLPAGHPPVDGSHAGGSTAPADPKASITGTVDVGGAMKDRIQGGALFLVARNAKSRSIVAVRRAESVTFPQKFTLSGADAMTPGTPFEGPLDVTARWSENGDAMPAPGNIEGTTKGVAVGAADVKVVLSEIRK